MLGVPPPGTRPTIASEALTALMALMGWLMPAPCSVQVAPPLVVARMVPPTPTAQPLVVLTMLTASRLWPVPVDCAAQAAPPLTVTRRTPF
jgi:hypothetical protein